MSELLFPEGMHPFSGRQTRSLQMPCSCPPTGTSLPMKHDEEKIFYDCFMCERWFQFGRYVYDGQYVLAWGVNICNRCRHNNWSGIDPAEHPRTVQLLKYRSAPIKLNANGRLEIPQGGPPQTIPGGKTPEGL